MHNARNIEVRYLDEFAFNVKQKPIDIFHHFAVHVSFTRRFNNSFSISITNSFVYKINLIKKKKEKTKNENNKQN